MKFYIATDHAGLALKDYTVELLKAKGHEVIDFGPFSKERVDYPDYAHKVANAVLEDAGTQGILICGSGIGMSMAANRHAGIRAALCHDAYTASVAQDTTMQTSCVLVNVLLGMVLLSLSWMHGLQEASKVDATVLELKR